MTMPLYLPGPRMAAKPDGASPAVRTDNTIKALMKYSNSRGHTRMLRATLGSLPYGRPPELRTRHFLLNRQWPTARREFKFDSALLLQLLHSPRCLFQSASK